MEIYFAYAELTRVRTESKRCLRNRPVNFLGGHGLAYARPSAQAWQGPLLLTRGASRKRRSLQTDWVYFAQRLARKVVHHECRLRGPFQMWVGVGMHAHACACMHARMHTRMHTRMHARMHTCMHTRTHARMREQARTCMHTGTPMCAPAHTCVACTHACDARVHACMHARMHACMSVCTRACVHACVHAC